MVLVRLVSGERCRRKCFTRLSMGHAPHRVEPTRQHPFDRRGDLPIEIERHDPQTVVRVVGDLDASTSPTLRDCLAGLLDQGTDDLVVALDSVPFCDSSGLGVLVGAHRRLAHDGGHLEVRHPRPPVRHLLEVSGLDRVFDVR